MLCEKCGRALQHASSHHEGSRSAGSGAAWHRHGERGRSRSPRGPLPPRTDVELDMPTLLTMAFASYDYEFSIDEVGEHVAAKLCACIGDLASRATGIKVEAEELGNDIKFKGLTYCQRSLNRNMRFRDGSSMKELLESLRCNRIKPTDLPPLTVLKLGTDLITLDHRHVWCYKEFQREATHKVTAMANLFEFSPGAAQVVHRLQRDSVGDEFLRKYHDVRSEIR